MGGNGRRLDLVPAAARRRAARDRLHVRPLGAPVARGHARRPAAAAGRRRRRRGRPSHPEAFPFRLPDIEAETEQDRGINLFARARAGGPGFALWLALPPGRKLEELDKETRERLKALGYLGPG